MTEARDQSRRYLSGNLKRFVDIVLSALALLLAAPIIVACAAVVFLCDRRDPIFRSRRVGRGGRPFELFKIRTMVVDAAKSGIDTTVSGDPRLLPCAGPLRALKLDELPQFLNVLCGDMSLVGPRPNVPREVARYTEVERGLISIRPGITDLASVVFSDLSEAIPEGVDPNLGYNQYVRPWKSRLGLHYVRNATLGTDMSLLLLTGVNVVWRRLALSGVSRILRLQGATENLRAVASRSQSLEPAAPPGASRPVLARDLHQLPSSTIQSVETIGVETGS